MRLTIQVTGPPDGPWQVQVGEQLARSASRTDLDVTRDALLRFVRREPVDDDIKQLGNTLLRFLVGDGIETFVAGLTGAPEPVELALDLPMGESEGELMRWPWEALHDGSSFLIAHPDREIVVTRLIAGSDERPSPVIGVPRVLFAIGSEMTDPVIRAGAELLGLLRSLDRDGGSILPSVLEDASLTTLSQACLAFRPDVVHIVAHGGTRHERGLILLRPDPGDSDAVAVGPVALADAIGKCRENGQRPMVVLSACETGRAGTDGSAALAAGLVVSGHPVVVGMSGSVADVACRYFTRRFGAGLAQGLALVDALGLARRAAYGQGTAPLNSVDWVLPALFQSRMVPPGYVPCEVGPRTGGAASTTIRSVISELGLQPEPIFCGRRSYFTALDSLRRGTSGRGVLVVRGPAQAGIGEKRLLKELSAQALRDGHVPLLVESVSDGNQPRAPHQVTLAIIRSGMVLLEKLKVPAPPSALIDFLDPVLGQAILAAPANYRASKILACASQLFKESRSDDADAIRQPFVDDIASIRDAAGTSGMLGTRADRRAIVLLGGVETWSEEATRGLLAMVDGGGLGAIAGEPAPVVLSFVQTNNSYAVVREHVESGGSRANALEVVDLAAFAADEAILAYQWVLMNPPTALTAPTAMVVLCTDGVWRKDVDKHIRGIPGKMLDPLFEVLAEKAPPTEISPMDDDDELRLYLARRT